MQDIRPMGNGGGGRVFGGDRRIRPHPNQALKCPRCESLNTKFCYYNNYNLSQPRHFCKSCRRYWTKGGVLRNVPVGGGCRKAKRSKPKQPSDSQKESKSSTSQHSSSESSSLTAATTKEQAPVASCSSAVGLLTFPSSSSRLFVSQNSNPGYESSLLDSMEQVVDGGIFPEAGSFTSLMTSNSGLLGFDISDISPFRLHHQHQQQQQEQEQKMASMAEEAKLQELGYFHQTAPVDLPGLQNRAINGGLTSLDWHNNGDNGLFDMSSSLDQGYWIQNQWADNEHPLYLP